MLVAAVLACQFSDNWGSIFLFYLNFIGVEAGSQLISRSCSFLHFSWHLYCFPGCHGKCKLIGRWLLSSILLWSRRLIPGFIFRWLKGELQLITYLQPAHISLISLEISLTRRHQQTCTIHLTRSVADFFWSKDWQPTSFQQQPPLLENQLFCCILS